MKEIKGSKKQIKSRILAFLLATIFAISVFYSPTMKEVDAAGKKVYVYVITSEGQSGSDYKTTYKYNKYGLIVKIGDQTTLKYDSKKRLKKYVNHPAPGLIRENTVTYTYDKKSRIKKMHSEGSHTSNTYTYTYSYDKKGRAVNIHTVFDAYPSSAQDKKCKYNKKNQLIELSTSSSTSYYKYDKNGNLLSSDDITYQNTYNKKKCLVKKSYTRSGTYIETVYKYKKIKVDKKYVKKIKKQQWSIINSDVQILFPEYG